MRTVPTILLIVLAAPFVIADDASPFPLGPSDQEFAGLSYRLIIPKTWKPGVDHSLLVTLHGLGGSGKGMAQAFSPILRDGFVVCGPNSRGSGWSATDIEDVKKITTHLCAKLGIGPGRLHANGYSNGGFNLSRLVFDEDLRFRTAAYIGAGYSGGRLPPHAKTETNVIVLVGGRDQFLPQAKATMDLLKDRVRSLECHVQPGVGHTFPPQLSEYYFRWLCIREGRFTPGDDIAFPWGNDLEAAKARMAAEKRPGLVYFYSANDRDKEAARTLQNDTLLRPLVRHYAARFVTVKLDKEKHADAFESLRLRKTPALVLLKPTGKVAKRFEGEVSPMKLEAALRKLSPDRRPPEEPGVYVHTE